MAAEVGVVAPARAAHVPQPGWVTAAGIVLIVVAGLSGVVGLLVAVMAVAMGPAWAEIMAVDPSIGAAEAEAMTGMMGGILLGMGAVVLVWAAANLGAGIGILKGRSWGRIMGFVMAGIGLAFTLLSLASTILSASVSEAMLNDPAYEELYGPMPEGAAAAGVLMTALLIVPFIVAYLVVIVALARRGAYFTAAELARRGG